MTELPFALGTVTPFFAGVLATVGAYFAYKMLSAARRTLGTVLAMASLVITVAVLVGPERLGSWLGLG